MIMIMIMSMVMVMVMIMLHMMMMIRPTGACWAPLGLGPSGAHRPL